MSKADKTYLSLAEDLLDQVALAQRDNRTDTPTGAIFGTQLRFNLAEEFPILTTKQVHFPSVVSELLWFLKGDTNIKYLLEHNNHIWTDWRLKEFNQYREEMGEEPIDQKRFEQCLLDSPAFAKTWGSIGKGYGHQWRNFGEVTKVRHRGAGIHHEKVIDVIQKGFDQIAWVICEIKSNPNSRRLIVSGWNPHEVNQVDLPPCHTLFQFFVSPMTLEERIAYTGSPNAGVLRMKATAGSGGVPHDTNQALEYFKAPTSKLSCQLYQRSADYFLGVPFNIASYALLTHLIADTCGLGVGDFVWTGGDTHLYVNHKEAMMQQLNNLHTGKEFAAPQLKINWNGKSIFELEPADISLDNYQHAGKIKAPVAV